MPARDSGYELPDLRQRDVEEYFRRHRERRAGLTEMAPEQLRDELVKFVRALQANVRGLSDVKFSAAIAEFTKGLRVRQERLSELSGPERNGLDVRTAVDCGWLDRDVDDLSPGETLRLATAINEHISSAYEINPE